MPSTRCSHTDEDSGDRCRSTFVPDACQESPPRCFTHCSCPPIVEKRTAARQKGARNATMTKNQRVMADLAKKAGRVPQPPSSLPEAEEYLRWVMNALATGAIPNRIGKTLVQCAREYRQTREASFKETEMMDKLDALERKLASGR